jgi:hypothetical protein
MKKEAFEGAVGMLYVDMLIIIIVGIIVFIVAMRHDLL